MAGTFTSAVLKRQIVFWLIALAAFIAFLMVFSSILLPFIAGMALAYFLDPVADWLERRGMSRTVATMVILIAFVVIFALSLMVIIPLLVSQASDFFEKLPGYISQLQDLVTSFNPDLLPAWIRDQLGTIKQSFSSVLAEGAGFMGTVFKQIWNSGMALVDIASLFVITPVVAFTCCSTGTAWSSAWIRSCRASIATKSMACWGRSTAPWPAGCAGRAR